MQVSWIDASQVTALAEGLRRTPTPVKMPPVMAPEELTLTVEDTDDFALPAPLDESADPASEPAPEPEPAPTLPDFRAKLQAIRDRAVHAGLIPAQMPVVPPPAEVTLPSFQPIAGAVSDRLAAFIRWAQPALTDAEIFIVDDRGDLQWGAPANSGLVLSAIMAWGAASRMSALAAYETAEPLRQILATGRHLAVVPCATRLGIMHIAITSPQLIPQKQLATLSLALIAAMDAGD